MVPEGPAGLAVVRRRPYRRRER